MRTSRSDCCADYGPTALTAEHIITLDWRGASDKKIRTRPTD
jgi:hypothetical protein